VLSDFDDTAAEQNVAEMLLKRFGDPTWQQVRDRFRAGQLTLKEYQEITFRNIQADRTTMQSYVKQHANLRPHFKDLWAYCSANGIPMAVVSLGLDFYIEALLEKEGLRQVPVHSVNTRFTPRGITYEYPYSRPGQDRQGNSKGLVADGYRQKGHFVFYVGDGLSDLEAAPKADVLFAHRTLAEECRQRGIPFRPFHDFRDVLLAVQEFFLDGAGLHSGPTREIPPSPLLQRGDGGDFIPEEAPP
jgi:2-hydroxy-3-keto-5-methylthiopentenyl-1-phosphate phosphatase